MSNTQMAQTHHQFGAKAILSNHGIRGRNNVRPQGNMNQTADIDMEIDNIRNSTRPTVHPNNLLANEILQHSMSSLNSYN